MQDLTLGFPSKLEHEVSWETRQIAPHLLIKALGRLAVKGRQVGVDHNSLSTYELDTLGDLTNGQRFGAGGCIFAAG